MIKSDGLLVLWTLALKITIHCLENTYLLNKIAFHITDFLKASERLWLATFIVAVPLCMENSHWGGRENVQKIASFLK